HRPHVVDLLLDERARELVVDREPVPARYVLSRGVPERGIEHDHGARSAGCGHRMSLTKCRGGRCGILMSARDHPRTAVVGAELVDGEENVQAGHVAVQVTWKIPMVGILEDLRRSGAPF